MKPIITVYSFSDLIKNWFFRIALLIVPIFALLHFSEISSGLIFLIILFVGTSAIIRDEQLCAFETFWEKNNLICFGLIKLKKKFFYKEIKSIQIEKGNSNGVKQINKLLLHRFQMKPLESIEMINLDDNKILLQTKVDTIALKRFITIISDRLEMI